MFYVADADGLFLPVARGRSVAQWASSLFLEPAQHARGAECFGVALVPAFLVVKDQVCIAFYCSASLAVALFLLSLMMSVVNCGPDVLDLLRCCEAFMDFLGVFACKINDESRHPCFKMSQSFFSCLGVMVVEYMLFLYRNRWSAEQRVIHFMKKIIFS